MAETMSPLEALRVQFASGAVTPRQVVAAVLAHAGPGTYLWRDDASTLAYAESLPERFAVERPALYGVPISLKDCFDLAGTVTTCGSKFYAAHTPVALKNSWIADRLLAAGAVLTGKTHLHQLAYGITGENAEYGDCVQPRDRSLLTGGSSSGAVASVREGSAVVAVGTDTGGSIRVPAALCGLAGYRTSHGLIAEEICWRGGAHLAGSFDTLGLIFRDLRDAPALGEAVFGLAGVEAAASVRLGCVGADFLHDCDADVLASFAAWRQTLTECGAQLAEFDTSFWAESVEVFTSIQASEAAALHRGNFAHFEPAIAARLAWGESFASEAIEAFRARMTVFQARMTELFARYDFLLLPCAPVSRLRAGEDHSGARGRILRYTAPISLAGLPVVALPGEAIGAGFGTGMQLVGSKGSDASLLAFAAAVGERISS